MKFDMTTHKYTIFKHVLIVLCSLPALVWFPLGFSLVVVSADQLLFGFDDMPLGLTLLSLVVGVIFSLFAFVVVGLGVWRNNLKLPIIITVSTAVFGVISIPASRLMTHIEQERRYGVSSQIDVISEISVEETSTCSK